MYTLFFHLNQRLQILCYFSLAFFIIMVYNKPIYQVGIARLLKRIEILKRGMMCMTKHKEKMPTGKVVMGKVVACFLTIVMLCGLLGIPALAEDATTDSTAGQPFEPMDGYVLAFGEGVSSYAYFSPFVPKLTYNGEEVNGYSILFGLKNTKTGEISEIAYCTDMPVDAVDGSHYQRLNLTDSTYAATHADKLRAIVLGSYPHLGLEELIQKSGIEGLSMCEAITGTQLAIWKTAHDDTVQIVDFMSWLSATQNNSGSGHKDIITAEYNAYTTGTDEYKAGVKSRIEALYNYLMALPEKSATSTVISTASFISRSDTPTVTDNGDDTYDVTVSATVNIPAESTVTLTAFMTDNAQYYAQTGVSVGKKEYTLTIQNVPAEYANGSVTLSLDGTQTVEEDVFLLDAEGIRGVSQSMIAPLSGTMPVHAEVKAEPDRVINIEKYEQVSNDLQENKSYPLVGISFEVYYVCGVDEFRNGEFKGGDVTENGIKPTEKDIADYAKSENLVGTITTGSDGKGSLNLSTADGLYLIVELPDERVNQSSPFFVCLPDYSRLDENGNPAYTITAYAKNVLNYGELLIQKVDKKDNTKLLSGATFELYRAAKSGELTDDGVEDIPISATTSLKMKPVSFYLDFDKKQPATSITTGTDGTAHIYGLPYGEYYLVETKAPDGYNELPYAVKVTVDKDSGTVDYATKVENSSGTQLPETGGMGTGVFTIAGLFCMAGSAMAGSAMVICKKKRT